MRTSMIAAAVVLVSVLASGCMILPKTKRELISKRVERTDPRIEELGLRLTAGRIHDRVISARAVRARFCRSGGREIAEYKISKGARFYAPSPGGSDVAGAFLLLFSIYTLPVTGVVTGLVVATHDDHKEQTVTDLPDEGAACDLPAAGVSVWLAVNGTELIHATTDGDGVASFAIDRVVGRGEALMGIDGLTPPTWQPNGQPVVRSADATPPAPAKEPAVRRRARR